MAPGVIALVSNNGLRSPMGHIRHEVVVAILVETGDNARAIQLIEDLRREMLGDENVPQCIIGPTKGVNGFLTYVFAPDGGKVGWETSKLAAQYRQRFIEAAETAFEPDIVRLQLGGDDGETIILETTDRLSRH